MEIEKYKRAIEIDNRLKALETVKSEICPSSKYRLTFVDKDNKRCADWKMKYIADILDKHDKMIREEIQQEVEKLHAEIETL